MAVVRVSSGDKSFAKNTKATANSKLVVNGWKSRGHIAGDANGAALVISAYSSSVGAAGRVFKCSFDHSKCQFFKTLNAIFSKVERFAPEAVVLNLIRTKCLPILLYGVESCPLVTRDKRSLEFTITGSLMKLFKTGSATVVSDCQNFFGFLPISCLDIRTAKFLGKKHS